MRDKNEKIPNSKPCEFRGQMAGARSLSSKSAKSAIITVQGFLTQALKCFTLLNFGKSEGIPRLCCIIPEVPIFAFAYSRTKVNKLYCSAGHNGLRSGQRFINIRQFTDIRQVSLLSIDLPHICSSYLNSGANWPKISRRVSSAGVDLLRKFYDELQLFPVILLTNSNKNCKLISPQIKLF